MNCFALFHIVYLFISLIHAQSSSLCAQYYSGDAQQQQCECDDITKNSVSSVSLKCVGHSYVPHFLPNIHYQTIELESCSQDLHIGDKTFADLNINTLRLRHCNLVGLNEESFAKINHLEKFFIENATINALATSTGNFQDIFQADSFKTLKSLTLKNIHYHQSHTHDKKCNLELLLQQLPQLYRLELINIYLDNYRHHNLSSTGQSLTYLKLINTRQTSLIPIEYLSSLERLILLYLPDVFHSQPLLASIKNLTKLKYIDFTNNQLTSIDGLRSKSIDQIDLTSNLIESIDEYTFEHVPSLRTLTLTGNPLTSIDKNAFCGISHLERLYIKIQKSKPISPLDNCLLARHPTLEITQDSQTKLQCDCQLVHISQLKRRPSKDVNRLFKSNELCLVTNTTIDEAKSPPQMLSHLHLPIYSYELETYLNCSSAVDPCERPCQERRRKVPLSTVAVHTSTPIDPANPRFQSKNGSQSISHRLSLLLMLLAFFLYL